ncbi:Fpg/Nei family DNA glycosylase [Hoyosella subflava]|uniref:Fpg/Nei family DNA glycosylase n=1 Tax=Hoyosella subflava TaxID=639313 RepID=UPI00059C45AD|nr:DNA-formamidopyrimidine glycosylase family protein [Hoyosella subflava]
MPEGHTLHRLARDHHQHFSGEIVRVSSPQGRFAAGAQQVDGKRFERAEAWGKHLLHHYEGGAVVHVHLGLYGKFTCQYTPMAAPVGEVRMRIAGATWGADLRGPTRCEVIGEEAVDQLLARLGPDPLRDDADPEQVWRRVHRSRAAVGGLLLNQSVIAGVGNVYRAEVLFRQGIAPDRPGSSLSRGEWNDVWRDLTDLMPVGVAEGKMITIRPEHDNGAPAYEPGRPRTYVYRRAGEKCRVCGSLIEQADLQARKIFWCPRCQV